jgi:hypothetical protein
VVVTVVVVVVCFLGDNFDMKEASVPFVFRVFPLFSLFSTVFPAVFSTVFSIVSTRLSIGVRSTFLVRNSSVSVLVN